MRLNHLLKNYNWPLFLSSFFLVLFGVIMIYSTTFNLEISFLKSFFFRQIIFAIIGFTIAFIVSQIHYRTLSNYTTYLYLLILILLILVIIFGRVTRGATSWLQLGPFNFEPSELTKLVMIIVFAKYFAKRISLVLGFKEIILSFIYAAIPVFLVAIQPDFGSAFIIFLIYLGMLLMVRVSKAQLITTFSVIILASVFMWSFILLDYQKERLLNFLNPFKEPLGAGYSAIQSMIAVGSGGVLGQGLGRGYQSQLNFLPEKHTDFIYAATAEELGLIGAGAIIVLFGIFLFYITRVIKNCGDNFGKLIGVGVLIMILAQILIYIGMNTGIMPVTGIPLPFVSYGGSSLVTNLLILGILQSIWLRNKMT